MYNFLWSNWSKKAITANILRKPKLKWSWNLGFYSAEINWTTLSASHSDILWYRADKINCYKSQRRNFFTKIHDCLCVFVTGIWSLMCMAKLGAPNQSILLAFLFLISNLKLTFICRCKWPTKIYEKIKNKRKCLLTLLLCLLLYIYIYPWQNYKTTWSAECRFLFENYWI